MFSPWKATLLFPPLKKFFLRNSKLYNKIYLKEACRAVEWKAALSSAKHTSKIHGTFPAEPVVPSWPSAVLGNTGTSLEGLPSYLNCIWQCQNKHHLHTRSGLRQGTSLGALCSTDDEIFLERLSISVVIVPPLTGIKES